MHRCAPPSCMERGAFVLSFNFLRQIHSILCDLPDREPILVLEKLALNGISLCTEALCILHDANTIGLIGKVRYVLNRANICSIQIPKPFGQCEPGLKSQIADLPGIQSGSENTVTMGL